MLRNRNTKIIATLGPSSSSPVKIHSLFQAGADIFRLNFSHGTHEDHRRRVFHIRQYEKRLGRPIAILGDLQGPKFRIGNFKNGSVLLKNNQKFSLDLNEKLGDDSRILLPHPEIFKSVKKNNKSWSSGTLAIRSLKNNEFKDNPYIENLSNMQIEHLHTKSSVPYRDPKGINKSEEILKRRKDEQTISTLKDTNLWRKKWDITN